jgi:CubicO group peptidase (beta-lactamase class C family)
MKKNDKKRFIALKTNSYSLFDKALEKNIFPGAAIGIVKGVGEDRQTLIKTYGFTSYGEDKKEVKTTTFYDIASLSKPLATTLAILCLIKKGRIDLKSSLSNIFKNEGLPADKKILKIKELLSHSAGFPAYRLYYEDLLQIDKSKRKERLFSMVMEEPLEYEAAQKSIYSDLGYMLLGLIVEKLSNQPLNEFVNKNIFEPLALSKDIGYLSDLKEKNKNMTFAAAELCAVRKRILSGEVSDENTYALGGVAGHAGLFANINGVVKMAIQVLDQLKGRVSHPNYQTSDLQECVKRQDIPKSTWALGFDTPSLKGSTGGRYLSSQSIGHLGFTGTSFWIDPTRDLIMVLLSNRVHPSRDNQLIKEFRPQFHDMVIESLGLV